MVVLIQVKCYIITWENISATINHGIEPTENNGRAYTGQMLHYHMGEHLSHDQPWDRSYRKQWSCLYRLNVTLPHLSDDQPGDGSYRNNGRAHTG